MKTKVTISLVILAAVVLASVGLVVLLGVSTAMGAVFNHTGSVYAQNQQWDEAIRDFSVALRFNPRLGTAYNSRAYAYARQNEWDKAIRDFDAALRLNPHDGAAYNNRGYAYANKGDFDKAIKDYTQGMRIEGTQANMLVYRGTAYGQHGDLKKAISDFSEALRLAPDNARTYVSRGYTYSRAGKFEEALEDFNEAIRLADPEAYSYRADLYARKADWTNAISDHRKALALAGNNPAVNNGLAWLLATSPDGEFRDGSEAIELAEKACRLTQWKQPHCMDTLAAAHAEAGNFEEAIRFQKEALTFIPSSRPEHSGMAKRLNLYEQRQAYRSTAGSPED
jgi:tetratricopeptide (TPR) repeat protein